MDLNFNRFELVAVAVSMLIINSISSDGRRTGWKVHCCYLVYAVLGLALDFHPVLMTLGS